MVGDAENLQADTSSRNCRVVDGEHATVGVLAYQLAVLKAELDYRESPPKKQRGPLIAFFALHAQQFAWTLQRVFGLGQSIPQTMTFKPSPHKRLRSCRLLIDVSITFATTAKTGIQRVVTRFVDTATEMGVGCPVLIREGQLLYADESNMKLQLVEVQDGDMLLLLDSNWQRPETIRTAIKDFQSRGGHVVAVLYDMIPVEFPHTCNLETVRDFVAWLDMALHACDAFLCISETTALALARHARSFLDGHTTPPIGWFEMGANLPIAPAPSQSPKPPRPYVLMVGTLEPRKGHPIGLDAMELLWAQGVDLDMIIVGRRGWNMRHFEERLRSHPEADRRLIWMSDATDEQLVRAYAGAEALVYPSIAEGYGLPIVEAASLGIRIIASDLDIFRETAPSGTLFFEPCCPDQLAAAIRRCLSEDAMNAPDWKAPTWIRSVESARDIICSRAYQIGASP